MEGEKLSRCPRRPLLDEPDFYSELFWVYKNYERGILPEGRNLHDQASKLLTLVRVIDAASGPAKAEQADRERRKQARAGHPPTLLR